MSNDPESTQPGAAGAGNETRDIGGSPTQPTDGGYAPPPAPQGGYAPPPQGYQPPPQGYQPPPQGYQQPPGGYQAPPPGGYAPPRGNQPPPGGYPLPPDGVANPAMDMKFSQGDFQRLFQQYRNVITKTDASVYGPEIAKANRKDIFLGVGMVALATGIFGFLTSLAFYSVVSGLSGFSNFGGMGSFTLFGGSAIGQAFGSLITGIIGTFITFFIGAYATFWVAKQFFKGQGTDFWTHAYLLSLSYAPLRTIGAVVSIIPILGGLVALVLRIYQYYHTGLAIQAYHRTDTMNGQLSVWIPVIAGIIVSVILAAIWAAIFVATHI
ncbi:MAG: YIP1 family protein [Chloroflexota bacterium]